MSFSQYPSHAIKKTKEKLYSLGKEVFSGKWQSIDVDHAMWELFNHNFSCAMPQTIDDMVKEIKPNLPWANDHFEERVGGKPLNPPPSNEWWPFAQRGNKQFKADEKFSHTYPERIWPPYRNGVRYRYGSMNDVIDKAEEAAEDAIISSIKAGLDNYSVEQLLENGRRSWPTHPFDGLDQVPTGYDSTDVDNADSDGELTYNTTTLKITHQRKDNTRYAWSYDKGVQTGDNADVGSIGDREAIVD